jgi:hypothetical protein
MARALHRLLCGALVALTLLGSAVRAQPVGVPAVVERLLQGFSSPDCVRRWQAVEEFTDRTIGRVFNYEESVTEVTAGLREQAPSKGPVVEQKIQTVSDYADEASQAFARLAKVAKSVDRSGTPVEVARKGLPPLTKVLDDPREAFMTRRLAAAVIAESARKSSIARSAGWDQPLPRLLTSKDPTARLLGSMIAATGGLLANQAPTKGQVVPELLRGLDADSFAARYGSTRALLAVSQQSVDRFCVDPSDSAGERAAGIRAWQTWWEQSKARSAGETIAQ